MIDLFVDPKDEIVIEFVVGKHKKTGELICSLDKKEFEGEKFQKDYDLEDHNAIFRKPNNFDNVVIYGDSVSVKGASGDMGINIIECRYKKVVRLIKSWTLGKGEPTEYRISHLETSVANLIGLALEEQTGNALS